VGGTLRPSLRLKCAQTFRPQPPKLYDRQNPCIERPPRGLGRASRMRGGADRHLSNAANPSDSNKLIDGGQFTNDGGAVGTLLGKGGMDWFVAQGDPSGPSRAGSCHNQTVRLSLPSLSLVRYSSSMGSDTRP
jgi:hypothetical protein